MNKIFTKIISKKSVCLFILSIGLIAGFSQLSVKAQELDRIERERAKDMLKTVKNEVKNNYYDPNFHGINLEEKYKASMEKLDKAASLGQAQGIIAQFLLDLNDSHTWFVPPARNVIVTYEWQMQMVGDKCLVTSVKPKSGAEAKGLKVGDEILAVENFRPSRKDMWKMMYYYNLLSPRAGLQMVVKSPGDKEPRQLDVPAKVKKMDRVVGLTSSTGFADYMRQLDSGNNIDFHRFVKLGNITVWKPLSFGFDPRSVGEVVSRFDGSSTVIFDFRGNPGGYVVTLEKLVGFLFDKNLKIADVKYRNKTEAQEAKTEGSRVFSGKIIVLVDSESGSAAEIFARLIQLEKRGIVIGDNSSGAVMQSRQHQLEMQGLGGNRVIPYGVSITNADVIMSDGKSLEYTGVTPDERLVPTVEDVAASRDIVLSRAIKLAGGDVSPEAAGKFFPYQWAE